jgi:hypothetical protein
MKSMFKQIASWSARWILALICIASFSLMWWAARTDSAIDDELAHIPAGYGYVHNLDYRLNPEHPPLVKALAMFPVLFLQPNFPTDSTAWTTDINGQWAMGSQFLYQSNNDANAIIQTARIMPIILTILTILLIYGLARRMIGDWWALLPTFLFAFDPTVLAHGHYVTTDIGASFGVVLATYFFLKYVDTPTTKHLWWAGLAFGVAQIAKFSMPLVTILFIFITLVLWLRDAIAHHGVAFRSLLRYVGRLALIIIIGYVFIVYPVYTLFTLNYPIQKQVSDTTAILASFANGPTPVGQLCHPMRCLADLDIVMANNPILRPFGEYLLGLLMVLQRSTGGNTIYFLGHIVNSGGVWYFPVLFLLKESIPSLIIIFIALGLGTWWIIRKTLKRSLSFNLPKFTLGSFVVLYWGYSMRSPLNIGLRHIIPTLPFIYILAASGWKTWILNFHLPNTDNIALMMGTLALSAKRFARSLVFSVLKYVFLLVLLAWVLLETLFAAPYFLSYFNEFAGSVPNGYRYVTDSNYDWGQDLLRLQTFVNTNPGIDTIAVDYFGGGSPHYYLGDKEVDWQSAKGNPADQNIHWLAISINQLQGATQPLVAGETRNPADEYAWLTALRPAPSGLGSVPTPDYRVGTSLFIYHL